VAAFIATCVIVAALFGLIVGLIVVRNRRPR
jgi:hypothetical protein